MHLKRENYPSCPPLKIKPKNFKKPVSIGFENVLKKS